MSTGIPYVDETWNPGCGCSKCSPGCLNCYAEELHNMRHRAYLAGKKLPKQYAKPFNEIQLFTERLEIPLHWRKPRRIFVCSMSDLFHPKVNIGFLTHIFDTIEQCPQHIFLILTKRPKQALKMMWGKHGEGWRYFGDGDYHPNVQFGVSISTQKELDEKGPILLQIPAAVRWISIEPMLEEIKFVDDKLFCKREPDKDSPVACVPCYCGKHWQNGTLFGPRLDCLNWAVVGCESGPKRRECKLEWVKSIVDQCKAAGVAVFVKQISLPKIVPLKNIVSEIPCTGLFVQKGKTYKAVVNKHGAIAAITERGLLGLKPDEFRQNGSWVCRDMNKFPQWARIREYP